MFDALSLVPNTHLIGYRCNDAEFVIEVRMANSTNVLAEAAKAHGWQVVVEPIHYPGCPVLFLIKRPDGLNGTDEETAISEEIQRIATSIEARLKDETESAVYGLSKGINPFFDLTYGPSDKVLADPRSAQELGEKAVEMLDASLLNKEGFRRDLLRGMRKISRLAEERGIPITWGPLATAELL